MAPGRKIFPMPFSPYLLFSLLLLTHPCSCDEHLEKESQLESFSNISSTRPWCDTKLRTHQANQTSVNTQQTRISLQKAKVVAFPYPQILQVIKHALDLAYRLQNFIKGKDFSRARKICTILEMDIRKSLRLSVKFQKNLNWKNLNVAKVTTDKTSTYIDSLSKRCKSATSLNPIKYTSLPRMKMSLNRLWTVSSKMDLDYVWVTKDNTYNLRFAGDRATYITSTSAFTSGRFTAVLKRPKLGGGLYSDFSLQFGNTALRIAFDFPGDHPERFYTYVFDGYNSSVQTFDTADDGSAGYHRYTIEWTKKLARFYFDKDWIVDYDLTTMKFTAGLKMNAVVRIQPIQYWNLRSLPRFILSMKFFSSLSPLTESKLLARPKFPASTLLRIVSIDYCSDFMKRNRHNYVISWVSYCGSRIHSLYKYPRGRFTAFIKCANGNTSGLVSSFYISSHEGSRDMDEIDFEFLGNKKSFVQTNYYVNGRGGRERWIRLGFDCSRRYHNYTIVWTPLYIAWYVDSRTIRLTKNDFASPFPRKPGYAYSSVWNASSNPAWVGPWSGANSPYFFRLKNITIDPKV